MDAGERAHERIGELIAGRYRLERLLGAGGMGAVYQAVHEFTQRKVAVKLMHPAIARSKIAAERFVREAQAPSSIGHRGIVEVLDGGRADDGTLYLVLELLEGQTLAAAIRGGALPPAQLGPIVLQLLDALGAAHAAGFVHRDIKPDNVFLVAGGDPAVSQVKLLDFGVISVIDETGSQGLTKAGMVLGTPLYMSPEQALGRRVDGRSDLWSLGAVCYQALTGKPPFAGKSAQALIVSISTEEHLPLSVVRPGLPLRVVKVVERALAKQPDKRWQSAEEMADALRQAMAGEERASSARMATDGVAVPDAAVRSQLNGGAVEPSAARAHNGRDAYRWVGVVVGALTIVAAAGAWALSRPSETSLSREASGALAATPQQAPAPDPSPDPGPGPDPSPRPDPGPRPGPGPDPDPGPNPDPNPRPDPNLRPDPSPSPSPRPNPSPSPSPRPGPSAGASLDASALSAVLRAHDAELQRCYEDSVVAELMRAGPSPAADPAPARLDVEITVEPSGQVGKLALHGDASDAMRSCAQASIQAWKFPTASAPTEARFPMVFQPNIVRQ